MCFMLQHGFKQFQNSFRNMIQICIADALLIFESYIEQMSIVILMVVKNWQPTAECRVQPWAHLIFGDLVQTHLRPKRVS